MTRWIGHVVMICLGAVMGLAVVEVWLAWMDYGETVLQRHAIYGWSNIPHKELVWRRPGGIHTQVRMNAAGFRDIDHSFEKPHGIYRIVVLGDSMVAAEQVELERTFSRLLETQLNQMTLERQFEVINLGVDGFGTDQELLLLRHHGLRYQPDLVLLCFFTGNDVADNYFYGLPGLAREKPYFVLDERGDLELKPAIQAPAHHSLKSRILGGFRWYRWVRETLYTTQPIAGLLRQARLMDDTPTRRAQEGLRIEWRVFEANSSPEWDQAWSLTFALIKAMREESNKAGADFLLVHLPAPQELARAGDLERLDPTMREFPLDVHKPARFLQRLVNGERIPYVSLAPILLSRGDSVKPFHGIHLEHDGHFTPFGHHITAEALAAYVSNRLAMRPAAVAREPGR